MTKIRIGLTLTTLLVVLTVGTIVFLYAKGYRFDSRKNEIKATGLLVIKSDPDGAEIYIDGQLETATNATINLSPAEYEIKIEKEGYIPWSKRLTIKEGIVTEETAHLFKVAPSLSAITFSGVENPIPSSDMSKISFIVPVSEKNNSTNAGLWILDMINLPIGFSQEPRQIASGTFDNPQWYFSPDDKEILLQDSIFNYLFTTGTLSEDIKINYVASNSAKLTMSNWKEEKDQRTAASLKSLPDEIENILIKKTKALVFSPDDKLILYTASASATLPEGLVAEFPGSSTQKQERDIKENHTYIYNIREDRNFVIDENSSDLVIEGGYSTDAQRRLSFFPTSRHLVLAEKDKITIMDYDGTNRQVVFTGGYIYPFAFPTLSLDRLIILTNLGSDSTISNLYSLGIK